MPYCPKCGFEIEGYRNPIPTVDIIIETVTEQGEVGIVLIKRKNPPRGWAIPGGFVDYRESTEDAAKREAAEETGLEVTITSLLGVYSAPERDPRFHTISVVYTAAAEGSPRAMDDAADVGLFDRETLPGELAFDHREILNDYFSQRERPEGGGEPTI